jgi:hypothetical protein
MKSAERALRLAVPCAGLLLFTIAPTQAPLRLSWSDEFVYAVMARNIAEGAGVHTNFYVADAILAAGFPLGDVHMPGQALLLAAAFRLMGSVEAAAFLPAAIGYVLGGWLMFEAALRLFGPWAGSAAALCLYLYPGLLGYASSAMPETPIAMLSALFLLLLVRSSRRPSAGSAAALAAVLVFGTLVRETFLVLAVLALLTWMPPPAERRRALLSFLLVLAGLGALVLVPAWRGRAPYPHFLSILLDDAAKVGLPRALWPVLWANLRSLATPQAHVGQAVAALTLALGVLAPLAWLRRDTPHRRLAAAILATTLVNVVPLLFIYRFERWAGFRAQLVVLPASILVGVGAVASHPSSPLRRLIGGGGLVLLGLLALSAQRELTGERVREYAWQAAFTDLLAEPPGCPPPRGIVAPYAFLYGWARFPAVVIWRSNLAPAELAALERALPIDLIAADEPRRAWIEAASAERGLSGGYRLVKRAAPDLVLLASAARADVCPPRAP